MHMLARGMLALKRTGSARRISNTQRWSGTDASKWSVDLVDTDKPMKGLATNFHFTRKCNYSCKFCFHTAKTSHVLSTEDQRKLIRMLADAGAAKLNFAGGEPFLPMYQKNLGEMVQYSKEVGFSSVSIISNGSHVRSDWFQSWGRSLDILGISIDSSSDTTNTAIGRTAKLKESQADHARRAARLCAEYGVKLKLNTVVCRSNKDEDMSPFVNEVHALSSGKLMRWKIFQVLELQGENAGPGAKRDVRDLLVTSDQFSSYLSRAQAGLFPELQSIVKAEPNAIMRASYIIIDEYGRLLDASQGGKTPTQSILEVGVQGAMKQLVGMMRVPSSSPIERDSRSSDADATAGGKLTVPAAKPWRLSQTKGFDPASFYERDGFYPEKWSREAM